MHPSSDVERMSPKATAKSNAIAITSVTCISVILGTFGVIDFQTTRSISHIENLGGGVSSDTFWVSTLYEWVSLDDTDATDADMKYVRYLWPCHGVSLRYTEITDKGLQELHGLPLNEIDLTGTKVTPAGIKELRQTLPNKKCRIKYQP
ncbi:MAG: hypothetical protein K0U86_07285 [Planctomycetes bacterium]|nr:hypothetical protein [Planctomycetota bacterium]MCH9724691.1 hypothetical protein [Planctomycetota bacterium]MCH9778863.1 hypothetical protein [Planctomycetota bacterium]MCH9792889.1 hypothetical protein [Planctomycetota bacterium]